MYVHKKTLDLGVTASDNFIVGEVAIFLPTMYITESVNIVDYSDNKHTLLIL